MDLTISNQPKLQELNENTVRSRAAREIVSAGNAVLCVCVCLFVRKATVTIIFLQLYMPVDS